MSRASPSPEGAFGVLPSPLLPRSLFYSQPPSESAASLCVSPVVPFSPPPLILLSPHLCFLFLSFYKNARCSKNRLQDPLPRAVGSPAGTSRGRCGSQSTGIRVILYLPLQKNEDRLFGERISSLSVITPETWALSTHTRVLERCALLEEAQLLLLVPAGTRASWTGTCGTRRHCGRPRGPALSYSETQSSKLAADRQLGGPSGSQALQSQRTRVLPGSNRVTLVPN